MLHNVFPLLDKMPWKSKKHRISYIIGRFNGVRLFRFLSSGVRLQTALCLLLYPEFSSYVYIKKKGGGDGGTVSPRLWFLKPRLQDPNSGLTHHSELSDVSVLTELTVLSVFIGMF